MKSLIFLTVLLQASSVAAAVGDVKVMPLENGTDLRIEEITPSRIIPYAYYDQAMDSIHALYPEAQIITKARGNMGSGLAMPYPWPNNPVELTAHSVRFFGYFLHFLLWAAAHRER